MRLLGALGCAKGGDPAQECSERRKLGWTRWTALRFLYKPRYRHFSHPTRNRCTALPFGGPARGKELRALSTMLSVAQASTNGASGAVVSSNSGRNAACSAPITRMASTSQRRQQRRRQVVVAAGGGSGSGGGDDGSFGDQILDFMYAGKLSPLQSHLNAQVARPCFPGLQPPEQPNVCTAPFQDMLPLPSSKQ